MVLLQNLKSIVCLHILLIRSCVDGSGTTEIDDVKVMQMRRETSR